MWTYYTEKCLHCANDIPFNWGLYKLSEMSKTFNGLLYDGKYIPNLQIQFFVCIISWWTFRIFKQATINKNLKRKSVLKVQHTCI